MTLDEDSCQGDDVADTGSDSEVAALLPGEPDTSEAAPSAAACAAAAEVSPAGYVSSPLSPYSKAIPGRITTWPASAQLEMRSVSCKCYAHPNCGSPARRRWAVSDRELLTWLFSGASEEDGTADRRRQLTTEHKAMWDSVIAKVARDRAAEIQSGSPAVQVGGSSSSSGQPPSAI